ncbi:hypothetical protein [Variovorax sp. PAMC 28711]|nr:hypothetical protein [Variovorax sp. PAMC 28711]
MSPARHRWAQAGWCALAIVVLAGVFVLYTRPAFMVAMIDQVWACF